jgi:hypothetical protein
MRMTLLPAVMCVALAAEVAAIIMARQAPEDDNSNKRRAAEDSDLGLCGD